MASEHEPPDNERDLDTGISGLYACRDKATCTSRPMSRNSGWPCATPSGFPLWLSTRVTTPCASAAPTPRNCGSGWRPCSKPRAPTNGPRNWRTPAWPSAAADAIHRLFEHRKCWPINWFEHVAHPALGTLSLFGLPLKLSATPGSVRRAAPLLGQHSEEILAAAGYDAQEIAALRESRVI